MRCIIIFLLWLLLYNTVIFDFSGRNFGITNLLADDISDFTSQGKDSLRATIQHIVFHLKTGEKPGLGLGDRRRLPRPHAKGDELAPVGLLYNEEFAITATAFLVHDCAIMTAAHAITADNRIKDYVLGGAAYNPSRIEEIVRQQKIKFYVGQLAKNIKLRLLGATRLHRFETIVNVVSVVAIGQFDPDWPSTAVEDWALLRIDKCIGSNQFYGKIKTSPVPIQELNGNGDHAPVSLSAPGWMLDRSWVDGIYEDPDCNVIESLSDAHPGIWGTNCNTRAGVSGGPILRRQADGALEAVAILTREGMDNESEQYYDSWNANRAISMEHIYSRIREIRKLRKSE